jgi:hypothetical protein
MPRKRKDPLTFQPVALPEAVADVLRIKPPGKAPKPKQKTAGRKRRGGRAAT